MLSYKEFSCQEKILLKFSFGSSEKQIESKIFASLGSDWQKINYIWITDIRQNTEIMW